VPAWNRRALLILLLLFLNKLSQQTTIYVHTDVTYDGTWNVIVTWYLILCDCYSYWPVMAQILMIRQIRKLNTIISSTFSIFRMWFKANNRYLLSIRAINPKHAVGMLALPEIWLEHLLAVSAG